MNILFTYPSWEERAYLAFKDNIECGTIKKAYIIQKKESLNSQETSSHLNKIEELCKENNIAINFIDIEEDGVLAWNTLKNSINSLPADAEITIDITTMSRNIIWMLLFFFKEQYSKVKVIYYQPKAYSKQWISKEPDTPRLLFKHSGLVKLGLPTYLIIITGFDSERTKQIIEYYDPKKVFLVIQTGTQLDNNTRNTEELHIKACKNNGISEVETIPIDSYGDSLGFETLRNIISENIDKANIIITSFGPKLSAISAYQCYLEYPGIAFSYMPCKEYNLYYSEGIGCKFCKEINLVL